MFQDAPVAVFNARPLLPAFSPRKAERLPVNLAPSTTFAKGTTLGQITASANDVQTVTVGATGGTYKLKVEYPVGNIQTTAALAFGASNATIQSALQALSNVGSGNAVVTGTGPFTVTFQGNLAALPIPVMTVDNTAATGGTVTVAHTTTGVTANTYRAYASGSSDGSQTPTGVLEYDVVTDAAGQVTYGAQAGGGEWGQTYPDAPMFISGAFLVSELVGFDANAATKLGGHYASAGVYVF